MTNGRNRLLLPLAIGLAIVAISTSSIFIRLAQAEGAPSIVIAALRLTIATLLPTPITLTKYIDEVKNFSRKEIALGALAGLFLGVHFAMWVNRSALPFWLILFCKSNPAWR